MMPREPRPNSAMHRQRRWMNAAKRPLAPTPGRALYLYSPDTWSDPGQAFSCERGLVRTDASFVAQRLEQLTGRMMRAGGLEFRAAPPRIVAVTKYLAAQDMQQLRQAGLELFGESRVQDALPKLDALQGPAAPMEWHFIGTLQGNKVKSVVGRFTLFHSVDSLDLARRIAATARELGLEQRVLLQVNISQEDSKHGFSPVTLVSAWSELAALPGLDVRGLMGIAAACGPARPAFRALRLLRDRLDEGRGLLPELSMGMSGDFEDAVAEGATLVRIGTSLFSEEAET